MMRFINGLFKDEEGQGLVEYGLILALIAVICIAALTTLGKGTKNKLNEVAQQVSS